MRLQNKISLLFFLNFILVFTNNTLCNLEETFYADLVEPNIIFGNDSIYIKNPNPILALVGYKPITNDTIFIEHKVDSHFVVAPSPKTFRVSIKDSNKILISLDHITKQRVLPIIFYNKGDTLGVKNIKIKIAGSYGDWIYFVLITLTLIIVLSAIFHKAILKKLSEIYKKNIGKYKKTISDGYTTVVDSFSSLDRNTIDDNSNSFSVASIEEVNRKFGKLLQTISSNHKSILSEILQIKLSQEQISKYEKKIGDKEAQSKKLENDLESARQSYKLLELDYKEFEKSHQEQVNALNDTIKTITLEKSDLQEKYKKLEIDFQIFRSRQSEMSANSLQITGVDKKKMDRYKDSCKSIIKTINEVPGTILKQSFENPKIMSLLNQVFLDHYMGNFEDLLKIRDDIENILLYQRTENSLVRNKFPGALSIAFEEFDPKYREIIFDTCIFGKVDKIFIGFRKIYGIKYQIEMSNEDLSQFDKMCDRIKSLENELVQYLQLSGFEPYSISLFEELTVQKSSYIENIGGLSLKEKFPYFEKKPEQRDLILEITQWAYKKDGGLWKNRKALVKIST